MTLSTAKDSITVRLTTTCIAAFSLVLATAFSALGGENCAICHKGISIKGVHATLPCLSCHLSESATVGSPGSAKMRAVGCSSCHKGHERIFDHAMAQRSGEKSFVDRTYARVDASFWEKSCSGCHVGNCGDCHGSGHDIRRPLTADCQKCHKGYFTGWDYSGRAPREDNNRYQRGVEIEGENFLKMLPDVHFRAGMACGACHSMQSLAAGRNSSKNCRDCHEPGMKVIEHRIKAHLEKLECYACHAAWAAQEYGTFYLRFREGASKEDFDLKADRSNEYLRSTYLKTQDAPPLGLNARGKVAPIRPMFLAYYTDVLTARSGGEENRLLAAEWRAYMPHTIQRGVVSCEGCHDTPRRFLLEAEKERIYLLDRDSMKLPSFWQQQGQKVSNGAFFPADRYRRMNANSMEKKKSEARRWKDFLDRGAPLSRQ
jgi:hypothetical protein